VYLMDRIMGDMISKMTPAEKKKAMEKMMPKIMEGIGPEDLMGMISWITEHCLSSMDIEERKGMLAFYHTMLREMEQKFL